jgi:16S rRNA (guanine1516-N2)-methyltransferase
MKPSAVFSLDSSSASKAATLASDFDLPVIDASSIASGSSKEQLRFYQSHLGGPSSLVFLLNSEALQLALVDDGGVLAIRANFHDAGLSYRREKGGGRSEMIAKAVGLKGNKTPAVIDATAGLGVDAFVLASMDCRVTMLERVPAVYALLQDGLERSRAYASQNDPKLESILKRMLLLHNDAAQYLNQLKEADYPDVVFLDPMFPERRKSAAVKKEMQIFHKLIGPDGDADQILGAALAVAMDRVVVKRPRIAPQLSGREPSHVIEGKRNRYDVYLTR